MAQDQLWQRQAHRLHFRNSDMDFYLGWVLSHQAEGGASFGEAWAAAAASRDGDPESWHAAWSAMADRAEDLARQGGRISAREAWLRAFTYRQAGALFLKPSDPRLQRAWGAAREAFRSAALLMDHPVTPVAIPFEGGHLPGYLVARTDASDATPTLLMIGGGETCAEELWFWTGAAGVRRGWRVLMVDLPGQGSTPFEGLHFRPDAELPIGAVVSHLLSTGIRPDRLALLGISGGGYMVCRAIAAGVPVAACVASAPIIDFYALAMAELPALFREPSLLRSFALRLMGGGTSLAAVALEKLCWQAGVDSVDAALELARQARVEAVEAVGCPTLSLVGEAESAEQLREARAFHGRLRVPGSLHVFTAADGADAHCQINNLALLQQVAFDWLDQRLGWQV